MYKSPLLNFSEEDSVFKEYYMYLFDPKTDSYIKLTALDFLANFYDEEFHKKRLESLYERENDPVVLKTYEKIFNGNYESNLAASIKEKKELEQEIQASSQANNSTSEAKPKTKLDILTLKNSIARN